MLAVTTVVLVVLVVLIINFNSLPLLLPTSWGSRKEQSPGRSFLPIETQAVTPV